jgi:integrase
LAERLPSPPLGPDALLEYVTSLSHLTPRSRDNVITVVWQAVSYAALHGAAVAAPPPRPARAPLRWRLREPRAITVAEMQLLLTAARRLPRAGSLRPATYATLFGLLWATGLRINEALGLDVGDLDYDRGLLTVTHGKFGKTRVLPLTESTVAALQRYVGHSKRPIPASSGSPIFVSSQRRRLGPGTALKTFQKTWRTTTSYDSRPPRLHDLRHSFAVERVAAWYSDGRDVDAMLPVLSTYLGHVSVENTRTYLRDNGLLLEHACRRFEARGTGLDRGTL